MKNTDLLQAMGNIDPQLITDAAPDAPQKKIASKTWVKWASLAACICLLVCNAFWIGRYFSHSTPSVPLEQVGNPMMEVSSPDEMSYYLGYDVPLLSKEVEAYILFIMDGYATMGQITYADGSIFRVQVGRGDISGIYGGNLTEEKTISDIAVSFYQCGTVNYAIWETDGYAFSYSSENLPEAEIHQIMIQWKGNQ